MTNSSGFKMTSNLEKVYSKASVSLALLYISISGFQVSAFSFTNCTVSGPLNDTQQLKVLCYKMGFWTIPSPIPRNVRILDISYNSFSHIRVGDFEDLWNLKYLNLSNSRISSIQDGTAKHFPNLITLNLANNKLTTVWSGLLQGFNNLQVLRLDGNMIESIDKDAFNTLPNLKVLNLTKNNLRQIAKVKPVLLSPRLEELLIGSNNFEVFDSRDLSRTSLALKNIVFSHNPLAKFQITENIFPNLDSLDVSYCGKNKSMLWNITEKAFLNSVKILNLTALNVSEENIAAVFQNVSWDSLYKVRLSELKWVNVTKLLRYACLPGLSVLRLQRTRMSKLSAGMFDHCSNLTELDLGDNIIPDISAPVFRKLTQLRKLYLQINRLTEIKNAFLYLPMLEFIDLSRNRISTLNCSDFANLKQLKRLYLYSNRISRLPSCMFKDLSNLETLRLGTNNLLTIGSAFETELPSLKELQVTRNKLSTLHKENFKGLSNLRTLDLGDNQISEIDAHAFSGLGNLTDLLLSSNKMKSKHISDPDVFSGMPNLKLLELYSNGISYDVDTLPRPPFIHLSSLEILSIHSQRRGFGKLPSNLLQGLTSLKMFYGGNMNLNHLHPDTFNSTPKLWFLELSKNAFGNEDSITAEVFHPIPQLTKLIIGGAQVHSLNFLIKANLQRLSVLKASENMLDVINKTVIQSVPHLRYLYLMKNTFACDCNNAFFIKWALTNNLTQVIYLSGYTCSYPMRGKSILDLNTESCSVSVDFVLFACSSLVVTLTLVVSFISSCAGRFCTRTTCSSPSCTTAKGNRCTSNTDSNTTPLFPTTSKTSLGWSRSCSLIWKVSKVGDSVSITGTLSQDEPS